MALNPCDLYDVRSLLSEEERAVQDTVARFTDERVLPIIGGCFDEGRFPTELIPEIAGLGLLGATLPAEYGGSGLNYVSYGLICQELERGDSGLRSFASVQSSLCMYPIFAYGTEEQKQRWLPDLCAGRALGGFGLTEPEAGSDAGGTRTTARLDEATGEWVIDGEKAFITNSGTPITSLVTVTARTGPGEISAIVVPAGTPGFEVQPAYRK
ncbi:MAG: acyl-CoA dehydrogenase, partial [Gammaproteobacteria bacterium]|nr:acyl-CoA dehydrogenase [Gammaproteobacteria bacterium]